MCLSRVCINHSGVIENMVGVDAECTETEGVQGGTDGENDAGVEVGVSGVDGHVGVVFHLVGGDVDVGCDSCVDCWYVCMSMVAKDVTVI